ncbi:hypothetical protein [Segeticoccus rhizosphaerae]|uniref:hypothetical protein n=1 Tax=Segeticoccus rhizosphaerae TaxID=1104777 RepID=UPI00193A7998|nr:hypothetical protein [Segeticoccus rhizosphaerae]
MPSRRLCADVEAERDEALESARTAWAVHSEHVETMNVRLLHAQAVADDWKRRAERAAAAVERVRALTYASDDGSEWPHRDDCDGVDDCSGCWAHDVRRALDGSDLPDEVRKRRAHAKERDA